MKNRLGQIQEKPSGGGGGMNYELPHPVRPRVKLLPKTPVKVVVIGIWCPPICVDINSVSLLDKGNSC